MLFFDFNYYHESNEQCQDLVCKCGAKAKAQTAYKLLTFFSFPFMLTDKNLHYKCYRCLREQNLAKSIKTNNTPTIVKSQLALGWFLISLVIVSTITTFNFIYPNDQELRHTPRIGDLVSLNREAIDKTGEFLSHPFTLARITAVREGDLTLVVSKWQFQNQFSLMKDFLAQKDQLNSYFLNNKIVVSRELLNDKAITPVMRRRDANYDREKIHSTNIFK